MWASEPTDRVARCKLVTYKASLLGALWDDTLLLE